MEHFNTPDLIQKYYDVSINRENDEYNELGLNISSQKRRQALVPWTKISYTKKLDVNIEDIIE